jgi:hypothetical protein
MARTPTSNRGATSETAAGWVLLDVVVALFVAVVVLASASLATMALVRAARGSWERLVQEIEVRNAAVSAYTVPSERR